MARIPVHLIREIVARTDFVGTLSRYLTLRPSQGRLVALCPFHKEKSPSFSASPERGLWYCFGCHAGGDLFQFLMRVEGWTFQEAARELGRRVGVDIDDLPPEERRRLDERQRLQDLVTRAAAHYHELLKASPEASAARAYLAGRGIEAAIIDSFQLGYAPAGAMHLIDWMRQHGTREPELVAAGLATNPERSGRSVDMFRDRIIFPILDAHGRAIAMGGRVLGDGQPKYLNSPETPIFSKRLHLYGLHQARSNLRNAEAILVEGYMDVVALHQAGFGQAVASLGTALTSEQANLLRRYAQDCILAYDADQAGQNATEKGIEIFEAASLPARVLEMPAGEDPDSLIRKESAERFRGRLKQARSVIEYRMEMLLRKHPVQTPEGKNRFLAEMLPTLGRVRDLVRWDEYLRRIAERLGVREETVRQLARSHRPDSPAAHIPMQAPYDSSRGGRPYRSGEGASRSGRSHDGDRRRGAGPGQRGGSGYGSSTGYGSYGGGRSGAGAQGGYRGQGYGPSPGRFPSPDDEMAQGDGQSAPPQGFSQVSGAGPSPAIAKAEQQLVRYLLLHTDAIEQARAMVSPDEFHDSTLRSIMGSLYDAGPLPSSLHASDLFGLLEEEGVHERVSEYLFGDGSEPLTPELFAGLLESFRTRRERAEMRSLGRAVRQANRDSATRRHDDPHYVKFQELNQRLKGSQ